MSSSKKRSTKSTYQIPNDVGNKSFGIDEPPPPPPLAGNITPSPPSQKRLRKSTSEKDFFTTIKTQNY